MENSKIFEIGDKVTWKVGNMMAEGVVLEDKGEEVEIKCHYINNKRCINVFNVKKEIVCIIEE